MDELSNSGAGAVDVEPELPEEHRELFDDFRSVFLEQPSDAVADRHVAAMVAAASAKTRVVPLAPRRKRVLVACGVGAALVIGGGVAAASGRLPRPVQGFVAEVVGPFGIDLPDGGEPATQSRLDPDSDVPPVGAADELNPDTDPSPSTSVDMNAGGSGAPVSPEPNGQSGGQGNKPDAPPGQSGEQGNKPDAPPGQSGEQGNKPDVPPGQDR